MCYPDTTDDSRRSRQNHIICPHFDKNVVSFFRNPGNSGAGRAGRVDSPLGAAPLVSDRAIELILSNGRASRDRNPSPGIRIRIFLDSALSRRSYEENPCKGTGPGVVTGRRRSPAFFARTRVGSAVATSSSSQRVRRPSPCISFDGCRPSHKRPSQEIAQRRQRLSPRGVRACRRASPTLFSSTSVDSKKPWKKAEILHELP